LKNKLDCAQSVFAIEVSLFAKREEDEISYSARIQSDVKSF